MNNTNPGWSNLPMYMMYVAEAVPTVIGNIVISLAILRYEALHSNKEYVIMLGLALADSIKCTGNLFAGIYRTSLVLSGTYKIKTTAWQCAVLPHMFLWSMGVPLATMMLTVVSADRLLCMLFPLSYFGWTAIYARRFVTCTFLFNIICSIYSYICTYGSTALVAATCAPPEVYKHTTHNLYYVYFTSASQSFAILSIVIYVFVVIFYKRMNVDFTNHPNKEYEMKRQRKVTVTLLLSALCTLFLFVIPFSLGMSLFKAGYYNAAIVLWCISNLNPLANVLLYPLRHKEIKQGIKALFICKGMPSDLRLWSPNQNRAANSQQGLGPSPLVARDATGRKQQDHKGSGTLFMKTVQPNQPPIH